MSEARALEPIKFKGELALPEDLGTKAELCLLPLDQLVVDERYQRKISGRGRSTIRRILENFDWRKFAPAIVTRLESGKYAIIDGQHRCTAALMHPAIDLVPCMLIDATPQKAAECFAAINGCVTAMTPGQLYQARVAAAEPKALALKEACDAAGVRILPHKAHSQEWQPGDTLAVKALEQSLELHGRKVLVTALMCVTETGDGNPGALRAGIVKALCEALTGRPEWVDAGERLFAAFDEICFEDLYSTAATRAYYSPGTAPQFMAGDIRGLLERHFSALEEAA